LDKPHELDDETIKVYVRVVGINEDFIWNMANDSLLTSSTKVLKSLILIL